MSYQENKVMNLKDGRLLLKTLNERKADVITDTASGAIASFPDGANGMPVNRLVVNVDPVQDLHGQDSPYPAGGGANIWDEVWEQGMLSNSTGNNVATTDRIRSKNYIPIVAGTSYRYAESGGAWVLFYSGTSESDYLGSSYAVNPYGGTAETAVFTAPEGATYCRFYTAQSYGGTYKNDISINNPSTVTGYHPYSNICPITGWTGCNVTRTGINIWDEEWELGVWGSDGRKLETNTAIRSKNYIPVKENTTYYLYLGNTYTQGLIIRTLDKNHNFISTITKTNTGGSFTTPLNAKYIVICTYGNNNITTYNNDISINYPATDTQYHPGTQNATYPITWQTEAGTVYGGKLTIWQDGTGTLVVDRAINTLNGTQPLADNGALNYGGMQARYIPIPGKKWAASGDVGEGLMSDKFYTKNPAPAQKPFMINGRTTNGNIYLNMPTDVTSAEAAVAWFASNPIQVSYLLAEPIVYNLTAQDVIALLKGNNNLWADCGNISIEYPADTKTYIDQKVSEKIAASQQLMELIVTANHEDSMKATKAYTTGNLLIVNGTLYKATTSIANGATLTVGTNVTATTVGAEIEALRT